ncbi:hypothetical protein ACFL5L_04020 [candidate division KSB1 bacterium]
MKQDEFERIQLVITHCDMLLYNAEQSYSQDLIDLGIQSMIPVLHNQFAFMHLVSTMFLVDKNHNSMGGACYKLLEPIGLANLLDQIKNVLNKPVGRITLGQYIRINRNKLTVHGDLKFNSLPQYIRDVTFNEEAIEQFITAGQMLINGVQVLREKLKIILVTKHKNRE